MARKRKGFNPFYVMVVLVGTVFTVTACAYGVMAYRAFHSSERFQIASAHSGERLMAFLDQRGLELMAGQLTLLGLSSFAAMWSDKWWHGSDEE